MGAGKFSGSWDRFIFCELEGRRPRRPKSCEYRSPGTATLQLNKSKILHIFHTQDFSLIMDNNNRTFESF